LAGRLRALRLVSDLVSATSQGEAGPQVSRRYNEGLPAVSLEKLKILANQLSNYCQGIAASIETWSADEDSA
jgi:hypothetical protein